jgi:hypothetical protein
MIQFKLDERTIERLADQITRVGIEEADVASARSARLAVQLLEENYPRVLDDAGLVGKPKVGTVYGGTSGPRTYKRPMRPLAEMYQGRAEKTSKGWVVRWEMRDDLNEQEKIKVRSVFFRGRTAAHDIYPVKATWLTGWTDPKTGKQARTKHVKHPGSQGSFDTLKLLRDRVYQRVRRGTV